MTTSYGRDAHGLAGEYREDSPTFQYRYGYQVAESDPRLVGRSDDRLYAIREAKRAASKVRTELLALGAPAIVSVWIQQRKRTVTIEFSEPETVTQ